MFVCRNDILANVGSDSDNDWLCSYTEDDAAVSYLCDAFCEAQNSTS